MLGRKVRFPIHIIKAYVRCNSSASNIPHVPFTTKKTDAEERFRRHHRKLWPLQELPVSHVPQPTQIFLPYHVFSATTSLTYAARLGNTQAEHYYDFFRRQWRVRYRTLYEDLQQQTLSEKEYTESVIPLHIYAGYGHPQAWMDVNSSDIIQLLSTQSRTGPNNIKTESFTRPFEGIQHQALIYLHRQEEERARKYIQRTYDPHTIDFTLSRLNCDLRSRQIYMPFWIFDFEWEGKLFKTYVAGWGKMETSGVKFFNPWVSAVAGGLGAVLPVMLLAYNFIEAVAVVGILGVLAGWTARITPVWQWQRAMDEIERLRREDAEAISRRYQDYWQFQQTAEEQQQQQRGQQQQQKRQRGQQQQQQQQARPTPRAKPKYPANDPQGLYQTLEVDPKATDAQIGQGFRRLAKKYHPDMVQGGAAEKAAAKERFQKVSAAYQILKDPRRRREYDTFGTTSM